MAGLTIQEVAKVGRVMRRPQHNFQLRTRPWQLQPFLLAPVLPGETMKNLLVQARVVSQPIKNPLIGWWAEYYFFYIKHRDLNERDTLVTMMLDPNASTATLNEAANAAYYHYGSTIPWSKLCLKRVAETYFRDDGEAWDAATIGSMPIAKLNQENWMDSVISDANFSIPDVNADLNANGTITASEVEKALTNYQWLKANNLTDMTYEDFLRTYGVSIPKAEEEHRPELLRYLREWTYPSNTVDPSSGVPSSALSWSIAERADKDRFFKEPGFLFGVSVCRPKVYFSKQAGSAAGMMNDAISWLPAVLRNDPYTSLKKFAAGAGPLANSTTAYWVDVRDLLLYGDQFCNFDLASTDAGMVALPSATLQRTYAASTDADALFVNSANNTIRQDGVVRLDILGTQTDQS